MAGFDSLKLFNCFELNGIVQNNFHFYFLGANIYLKKDLLKWAVSYPGGLLFPSPVIHVNLLLLSQDKKTTFGDRDEKATRPPAGSEAGSWGSENVKWVAEGFPAVRSAQWFTVVPNGLP